MPTSWCDQRIDELKRERDGWKNDAEIFAHRNTKLNAQLAEMKQALANAEDRLRKHGLLLKEIPW